MHHTDPPLVGIFNGCVETAFPMQCGLPTTCEDCLVGFCVKICIRTSNSNFSPLTPNSSFSFSPQALRVFRVRFRCTPLSSKAQKLRRTAYDPFRSRCS